MFWNTLLLDPILKLIKNGHILGTIVNIRHDIKNEESGMNNLHGYSFSYYIISEWTQNSPIETSYSYNTICLNLWVFVIDILFI